VSPARPTSAPTSGTATSGPLTLPDLAAIDIGRLQGVGERKREKVAALGITSVLDLLTHYPHRWIDRTRMVQVGDVRPGDDAVLLVTVRSVTKRQPRRGRPMVNVEAGDGTGRLLLVFFNQPWRERQLQPGMEIAVSGKADTYRGRLQLTNPLVDLIGNRVGRIVPVYPQSEKAGVYTRELADWAEEALTRCRRRGLADPVPPDVLARHGLVDRQRAVEQIHFPDAMADVTAARRRLVFDELLRVQLALVLRKRALEQESRGLRHAVGGELVRRFHERLPFPLTSAQQRAIAEIDADLAGPHPMHRLLQGDVGAGKTVVAVTALLTAVEGGHQGALMAPTEVLAEQHAAGVRHLLADLSVPDPGSLLGDRPLRVELLTHRTTAAERRRLLAGLQDGEVDIVIGTHALIEEGVRFRSLGVVVIDEQHRFGVEQRAALREKGAGEVLPDVLVMTATPIPRTAAITVYGDLDVSVLDELPPGRTPVTTVWPTGPDAEEVAWAKVREEVAAGRQAYVVCPLVEESEKLEVASAEETYERLAAGPLRDLRLGILHGRVPPAEKQATMDRFRDRDLDVLVATTVIEVGVDVPNATVMVVLDADRFGIAQLHQLRGRVGRGAAASWCYLLARPDVVESPRLEALVRTTDGFELAEVDLELRGEGTLFGVQQKGRNDLKLASLRRDREWVEVARAEAFAIVDADPHLAGHPQLAEEVRALLSEEDADRLLRS